VYTTMALNADRRSYAFVFERTRTVQISPELVHHYNGARTQLAALIAEMEERGLRSVQSRIDGRRVALTGTPLATKKQYFDDVVQDQSFVADPDDDDDDDFDFVLVLDCVALISMVKFSR